MRRALVREFASRPETQVIMTLDSRLNADDGPWSTVRIAAGEEPATFEALAARADYTLAVAPETGGVLAQRARILERSCRRSLGSAADAIELTGDKLRLGAHLADRGIATPASRLVRPQRGLPRDHSYPAVLKPVDGAGSIDTFLVGNVDDLPNETRALEVALLQPFVPGVSLSASFLVGSDGCARLVGVGRQLASVAGGRFQYEGGVLPAPHRWLAPDVTRAVASVPGLRGFVGVDFVYDEATQQAQVIEINPRPTTSLVGLLHLLPAGRLARAWLDSPEELAPWVHSRPPITFRADGTIANEKGLPTA